ncbi:MAG: sugar transferase [Clostridia bacterium]|nr:sugar transferase [Clostridia bacterium]
MEVLEEKNIQTQEIAVKEINKINDKKVVYKAIKRVFDIVFSLIGLILLSPVFLIIAVIIKLDSKGPVFFVHSRIGEKGKSIGIYKFRTMVNNAEDLIKSFTPEQKEEFEKSYKLENDPRITKIGNFLRKTSLDELPQILNILKGELSIIGPRPIIQAELDKYEENKDKFLSVRPGLTGYWAANGRSDTTYEERMKMELYYVDNMSFKLDVKIFFKTIFAVLKKEGAR